MLLYLAMIYYDTLACMFSLKILYAGIWTCMHTHTYLCIYLDYLKTMSRFVFSELMVFIISRFSCARHFLILKKQTMLFPSFNCISHYILVLGISSSIFSPEYCGIPPPLHSCDLKQKALHPTHDPIYLLFSFHF